MPLRSIGDETSAFGSPHESRPVTVRPRGGGAMLNRFTKMLLVGTSLAPVLVIMAVDFFFSTKEPLVFWSFGTQLLAVAAGLVGIAFGVMNYAAKNGPRQQLNICKAKNSDKEVLTFLLAYLLPVVSKHDYLFREFNWPTVVILLMLCVAVYHSSAFDFNPLLGMLGYHFYEVEDDSQFPYLLISSRAIKKPSGPLTVVQLFDYTFLAIET
jgi:hypothetical protein